MHHAYVESDTLKFDSGDQKPGSRTSVTFPMRGDFQVLCGIHPKMKLAVHVK
jgi:plastocyanin